MKFDKEVLKLGKLLVKELNLEESFNTLGRWISHHVSELIMEVERSKGKKKADAENRCRDAILALWKHIHVLPNGHRPLENIIPLLKTIEALDPKNNAHFYRSEAQSQIEQSKLSDQAKNWLELSLGIDYTARVLIDMCLRNVIEEVSEENQDLLGLSQLLDADTPPTILFRILTNNQEKSDKEFEKMKNHKIISELRNRRERLNKMLEMSNMIISSLDEDISKLEQSIN